ncbi:MAG: AAA family ATPase [Alphaproteobacteria bacterium]|nr:AAA family ATPase [Alphaproteobacteria bacterium]
MAQAAAPSKLKTKNIACPAAEYESKKRAFEIVSQSLDVQVQSFEKEIVVTGNGSLEKAVKVIEKIVSAQGRLADNDVMKLIEDVSTQFNIANTTINVGSTTFAAKTKGQAECIKTIRLPANDVCLLVGPAGTGKTFLACAHAAELFEKKAVDKIVVARPAVEAGEKLGYLPGGMEEKIDPYLQPIYDSFEKIWGAEKLKKMRAEKRLQIVPLGFLRGRTIEKAAIVGDEMQNATAEQMRMFITRLGTGSKMYICGDRYQSDLPTTEEHGLNYALRTLEDIEGFAIFQFAFSDTVRHPRVKAAEEAFARDREAQKTQAPAAANDSRQP